MQFSRYTGGLKWIRTTTQFTIVAARRFRSFCSLVHWAAGSLHPALRALASAPSRLSGVRSNQLSYEPIPGGDERVRTDGLLLARQALSQLSYTPVFGCDQLSRSTLQQSEDVLTPSKPYSAFDAFLTLSSSFRDLLFFRFTP